MPKNKNKDHLHQDKKVHTNKKNIFLQDRSYQIKKIILRIPLIISQKKRLNLVLEYRPLKKMEANIIIKENESTII